jgi:hypothetical protein
MRYLLLRLRASVVEADAVRDLVFILVTLAFFALCWAYVRACERL